MRWRILKKIIFVITLLLLFQNCIGQKRNMPSQNGAGKCYAKCIIPPEYFENEITLPIFIGEKNENVELDSIYFQFDKAADALYLIG